MKVCKDCGVEKDIEEFYITDKKRGYRQNCCKECAKARNKKWRENNPDRIRESWRRASKNYYTTDGRRSKTLKQYGLTVEAYNELFEAQAGKCKICNRELDLVVDHCHVYNVVRGLLCDRCNVGLGCFEDDIERLREAIEYLSV